MSQRYNWRFFLPPWLYAKFFAEPIPQTECRFQIPEYLEPCFHYQEIVSRGPVDVIGLFQTERYFDFCEAEVRRLFAPHPHLMQQLEQRYGELLTQKTCSIHVRRGDFLGHDWFRDISKDGYYDRAIAQFDNDTTFVCFSDNIPWCKRTFQDDRFYFVQGQRDIADLFLMSMCKSHIIANSSFSWWGAWLDPNPSKRVVAPQQWIVPKESAPMKLPGQIYPDICDLIPPTWLKV